MIEKMTLKIQSQMEMKDHFCCNFQQFQMYRIHNTIFYMFRQRKTPEPVEDTFYLSGENAKWLKMLFHRELLIFARKK